MNTPVEPNASRVVYSGEVGAWIALHRFSTGKEWVLRRHAEGHWVTVREATDEEREVLRAAGALEFPLSLTAEQRAEHPEWPQVVPYFLVGWNQERCRMNHGMTPAQLAELGGLSPEQVFAVVNDLSDVEARRYYRTTEGALQAIERRASAVAA